MSRLPDDRPARTDEGDRASDPLGRARGLHDEVERTGARPRRRARGARRRHPPSRGPRRPARPSLPGPSTAARVRRGTATWSRISQAAASGSMKTASSSVTPSGTRGDSLGQCQPFGVRARMAADAEDGPLRAVPPEAPRAPVASAAGDVDLAHDAACRGAGRPRAPRRRPRTRAREFPRSRGIRASARGPCCRSPREGPGSARSPRAARAAAPRARRPGPNRRRGRAFRGCYALQGHGK